MITLSALPDPAWPVVVLALIQFADGLMCIKPARFIAECFEDVEWPREFWWTMPVLKFAATAGLLLGVWISYLGLVTSLALIAYFITAIGMHIRAKDFGRNLFANATGMLGICVAVTALSFG